jgi:hypothetical protein
MADWGRWRVSWGGKPQWSEQRTAPEEPFSGGPAHRPRDKIGALYSRRKFKK